MPLRFEQFYRVKRRDNLGDPDFWNSRFGDIDRRANALEEALADVDAIGNRIESIALARLDTVVTPTVLEAKERLRSISTLFTAESVSTVEVGTGEKAFVILENQRQTFVTIDYVSITKVGDASINMLGRIESFDRDTGDLVVTVEQANGTGEYAEWRITISSPPDLVHATVSGNPHGTTAAQVGAYTTSQTDTAITTAINALKGAAPSNRDTLKELSDAIDALSAATNSALNGKANNGHNHNDLYYTKAETTSLVGASKVHGTCELIRTSASQIRLVPKSGGYININGVLEAVPQAGVNASNTSLSSNTRYYVYAYMNGGAMALDLSTTAPTANAIGILVKTGATSRTLVGQIRTDGTSFADSEDKRLVRSYYNDRGLQLSQRYDADRTRSSTSTGQIHSDGEIAFLTWADEAVMLSMSGTAYNNSSSSTNALTLAVDGSTSEDSSTNTSVRFKSTGSSTYENPVSITRALTFGEGYHTANLFGRASSGTLVVRDGCAISAYAGPNRR